MTRRRELFEVTRWARRYDRQLGKFVINISYETATEITPRTIAVAEAFGLGVDQYQKQVIYDDVELKIGLTDVVYITGESGSGKSVLLKALEKDIRQNPELGGVINIADIQVDQDKPLIDTVGKTLEEGLELLSRVGLNDAFLFVRRYDQLSDGQKYRYRIAKMIETGAQFWVMDEFCATLDRDTAKIVAFNVQKLSRQLGKAAIAATTHTDLFQDLQPTVHIHKRFGKEIQVRYFPNSLNRECSLVKEMRVEEGSLGDYKKLADFHYRGGKVVASHKVFVLKRGDEAAGVIVYSSPSIASFGRKKAFNRKLSIDEINQDVTLISRVVVHPKYRTIGLGVKLVQKTLFRAGKLYIETVAVMARYNPFFEHAGLTKIAESKPDPGILAAIEKLAAIGFNPVFLSSTQYNLQQLCNNPATIDQVKAILKEISRCSGVYRKRIASVRQAYLTHQQFCEHIDKANSEKLAKMLRILNFLTQTKVYLFWENPATNFITYLNQIREKRGK